MNEHEQETPDSQCAMWLITPHEPLITRDGRPFDNTEGARAQSLPFPPPSVTAGGARTRAGSRNGTFVTALISDVLKIAVQGPFLAEQDDTAEWQYLFPAPSDALLLEHEQKHEKNGKTDDRPARIKCLMPHRQKADELTDFGNELEYLIAYEVPEDVQEKPLANPPSFWKKEKYFEWLHDPKDAPHILLKDLGHNGPMRETRVHVAIDPNTFASQEGMLFQTSGMEYLTTEKNRLGLALQVQGLNSLSIDPGIGALGGERRLVKWQQPPNLSLPAIPDSILKSIKETGNCRMMLLTPAWFAEGWKPTHLVQPKGGLKVLLKAAVVKRPEVISGWDFKKGKAKPTRRLAPAGSVYYLKLEGSEEDIEAWIREKWFTSISDDDPQGDKDQTRRDGFGIAAIGTWKEKV